MVSIFYGSGHGRSWEGRNHKKHLYGFMVDGRLREDYSVHSFHWDIPIHSSLLTSQR